MNNGKYITNVNADRALTTILSHFDTNYIYSIVDANLENRWRPYGGNIPTLKSFEDSFQQLCNSTPDHDQKDQIMFTRNETYKEILNRICMYYNLSYSVTDENLYGTLYWIYYYFLSNFTQTLVNFYTNFLYNERSQIYSFLNMDKFKKEKDSSIVYSKKLFPNDDELSLIHANIPFVLDELSTCMIDFEKVIQYGVSLENPSAANLLITSLADNGNIFTNFFACYLRNPSTRDDVITSVKLSLSEKYRSTPMQTAI